MTLTLKAMRVNQGYSQFELCKKLGVSQTTISSWEQGKTKPNSKNIYELAKIYSVDPTVIFDTVFKQKS